MTVNRRAALMAAVFSLGLAPAVHAETLADAVTMAYQSNPALLVQRSLVKSADEAYLRARRGLDPTITANVTASFSGAGNTNPLRTASNPNAAHYTELGAGGVNLVATQTL